MEKQLTNRQKQAIETKQKIIDVVCDLLKNYTLEEVTINKICHEANISVGAFYHHFKTKEEVVCELFFQFDDLIKDALVHKPYHSTIDAIVDLLYHEASGAENFGLNITAEIIKLTIRQNVRSVYDDENRFFHVYLKQLIDRAKEEKKIIQEVDTNWLSSVLLRHTRGIGYDWVAHHGNYNLEKIIKEDIKLLLNNFLIERM